MNGPRATGGARWSDTLAIVREFAKVDSSIAHVFGFHHLMLATVRLFSRPDQWQPWFEQTARKNWFWGNALNPLDTRTQVKDFKVEDALLRAAYRFGHYNQVHTANLLGLSRNVTRTRLIKIGELAVNKRRPGGNVQGERMLHLSI